MRWMSLDLGTILSQNVKGGGMNRKFKVELQKNEFILPLLLNAIRGPVRIIKLRSKSEGGGRGAKRCLSPRIKKSGWICPSCPPPNCALDSGLQQLVILQITYCFSRISTSPLGDCLLLQTGSHIDK